jgi:hypothetical protein
MFLGFLGFMNIDRFKWAVAEVPDGPLVKVTGGSPSKAARRLVNHDANVKAS